MIHDAQVITRAAVFAACLLALTSVAHADRLVLKGGAVLEGTVSEQGDKVVVTVASGQLSFSRDEVERVERAESEQARFERRLAKIKPGDVAALLKFADQLRDREDHDHEREVLRKILEADPDHEGARIRLGYVKSDAGWVTVDEQKRAQGLVRYEGQWVTPAQKLELERIEAETERATLEREKAELQLATQQAELRTKLAEAERAAAEARARAQAQTGQPPPAVYFVPWVAPVGAGCRYGNCAPPRPAGPPPKPFINGARHPSDQSFAIPGARDPKSYF